MKRQTLRALAKSRGLCGATVRKESTSEWYATVNATAYEALPALALRAPTRRSAAAGLRAALLALPEVRRKDGKR